jgi:hypothetical protein
MDSGSFDGVSFNFDRMERGNIKARPFSNGLKMYIFGASWFPVGQHGGKKLNPLTRTPESKREWVVPHERVEVYQGPTALSCNGSTGSPRTGGEGQIQSVFGNEWVIFMPFFC